jgi:hypothetical protein
MKLIGTAIIGFFIVIMIGGYIDSSNASAGQSYNSSYSQCKNSAETKFMIQAYKQKYSSVSDNQIASIICKDAK